MLSAGDQALVARDREIPGLCTLLDPERLADLLQAVGEFEGPLQLECNYIRYKPGVNCIARFRIESTHPPTWAYAKAFASHTDDKIAKAQALEVRPGPLGPGSVVLPQQRIIFLVFPNDARLESLQQLAEPGVSGEMSARLFKGLVGWEAPEYRVLNYKPERRLATCFSNAAGERLAVKFYDARDFDRIRKYRKRLEVDERLPVPRWIAGSKSHRAMVFGWIDGQPLDAIDGDKRRFSLEAAGRALALFHTSEQPGLRKRQRAKATRALMTLAEGVGAFAPDLHGPASELAAKVGRWWRRQPNERIPVHGDFDASQVIIGEQAATLIDGDEAHLGNAISDLACFRARAELDTLLGRGRERDLDAESAALLNGYRSVRTVEPMEGFPQYVAAHLLRLSHAPFRARAGNWPEQTALLLERCRAWWSAE